MKFETLEAELTNAINETTARINDITARIQASIDDPEATTHVDILETAAEMLGKEREMIQERMDFYRVLHNAGELKL